MRRILLVLTAALIAIAVPAMGAARTVGENPVDWTPHVLDGEVRAMVQVGDAVVVGGDFTSVTDSSGTQKYERWFLFAFQMGTGRVLDWAPWLDGPVLSLAAGPNGTVFVGGSFATVGDRAQRGIAQLDLSSGQPTGFAASLDAGDVRTTVVADGFVYIGGSFKSVSGVARTGVARLHASDGRVDEAFDAKLSAPEIGRVKVEDLDVSPRGDRLVVIGALTKAGKDYRVQVAMFDLTSKRPRLADWWTDDYNAPCKRGFDTYLRGVDFSPDGSYLVIVTTGRHSDPDLLCDTASRFETYKDGEVAPTWVNHTGGDSLYAVMVTDSAIYVGGHQRWMDNPHGKEYAGPGASYRQGLAAIDPESGKANGWNPTHSRGVGVRVFAMTDAGLLVGSDTDRVGREYHGRLGLFPN